jgi:hypothetical protein
VIQKVAIPTLIGAISPVGAYSRFRVAAREIDAVEWLFPHQDPHGAGAPKKRSVLLGVDGQVFVRGVEVKATFHDLRHSTETLNLL